MGPSLLVLTAISGLVSVAGTLLQKKAVKAQAKTNARIERRNTIQKQADLKVNESIEEARRGEIRQDVAAERRSILKKARKNAASTEAQAVRQGLSIGSPSLDTVLQDQAIEEEIALNELTLNKSRATAASRGRTRTFSRDAFAVGQIGETNAQAIEASGKNRGRALGLAALGQGLSTVSNVAGGFV